MSSDGGAPDEYGAGSYCVFQSGNPGASPSTELAWIYVEAGSGSTMIENWVLGPDYLLMNPTLTGLVTRIMVSSVQYDSLQDFLNAKNGEGCTYIIHTCVTA